MGGGGGRKEKENSAPAAKKRREEDKQSSKSTATTTTTNAPATGSTVIATKPRVGSLFYITHSFFYNLLQQLAKGGGGEGCSYQELLSLLSLF